MSLDKYKKLTETQHVLRRAGMYIGSIDNTQHESYYPDQNGMMVKQTKQVNPGLVKMFDEVISNAVDEHIRNPKKLTCIDVTLSMMTGEITVEDNGGIPVKQHPKYNQYVPEMIFGELRTGSNFDDDARTTAGLNGLGVKIANIFAKQFKLETSDGQHKFVQTYRDNMSIRSKPTITKTKTSGTKLTFMPDYDRLNCSLDQNNFDRLRKRVYDIAGCNEKLKVYLNGDRIQLSSFNQYVSRYVDRFVEEKTTNWDVLVAPSKNGFEQVSFVNGVETFNGGTHIDHVLGQLTDQLRQYIRKKHKIDIKPSQIKQHLFLFVRCTINNPTFTSQTKEYMSSDVKSFGSQFEVTDKFIRKLVKEEIVQNILDWAEAQQRQKELAKLRQLNKKTQNQNYLKKIVKFDDATSRNRSECELILTEGDSAKSAVMSARDPKTMGVFPLRGKPLNVRDVKVKKLTENKEFASIMSILGLKIDQQQPVHQLRFRKLLVAADADFDGIHIISLILNMFQQLWPDLLKEDFLYRLKTPVIVATAGKKTYEFFNRNEYEEWAKKGIKHKFKWYKGLGSWTANDFKRFLSDTKYHEQITYIDSDDFDQVDLAFDKRRADDRKEWLGE